MKTFLEIGTCDFDTNLPFINSGNWKGIMVEPSPPFFDSLKSLAHNSKYYENLILENCAISDKNGQVDFAVSKQLDTWQRGISSVLSETHEGTCLYNLGNNKDVSYDKVIKVPCMTLDSLLSKYSVSTIDYLKIDTEGHELNILNGYSWKILPTFLKVETKHIDSDKIKKLLERKNYRVYFEKEDLYAIFMG